MKNPPSIRTQHEMLKFFMRTSAPRILSEKEQKKVTVEVKINKEKVRKQGNEKLDAIIIPKKGE